VAHLHVVGEVVAIVGQRFDVAVGGFALGLQHPHDAVHATAHRFVAIDDKAVVEQAGIAPGRRYRLEDFGELRPGLQGEDVTLAMKPPVPQMAVQVLDHLFRVVDARRQRQEQVFPQPTPDFGLDFDDGLFVLPEFMRP
jgi:hypothetical protein